MAAFSLAAAVTVALTSAGASAGRPLTLRDGPVVVHRMVSDAAAAYVRRVRAFWTADRMARARPVEIGAGAGAAGAARAVVRFSRREVRNTSAPGARTNGKVFFLRDENAYVCSGTAVTSRSRSLMMTAGHCATLLGEEDSGMLFVPAYHNLHGDIDRAPFGTFVAASYYAMPAWHDRNDPRVDVAFVMLERNERQQTLQQAVGARELQFNQPRAERVQAFGYPAKKPFDGERLYRCDSHVGRDGKDAGRPWMIGIGCDMSNGSSGGGWLIKGRYINGLNSFCYRHRWHNVMFSPYFGNALKRLYSYADAARE